MKLKTSEASNIHALILNLSDEINLEKSDKYIASSNLSIYYTWKKRRHMKKINLKLECQRGIINFSCLMDHILNQIFKVVLRVSSKIIKN